ncbi:MAG: NADH:flavin oxidoreductase/NADH oxidase [Acetobacter sp.]|nr:NADH:flavin oxidoreductase/NADH oxidase [Acetobacter sp.]MBR2124595.1 NADH:flavin oxidoreductase/NADH oxidase [Acetobacter sp.]
MPALFDPYSLKSVTLRNRIAVSPMCQYQAKEGLVNEWHKVHYTTLAHGGAGLVTLEATAVSPEGRITPRCLGLWNDKQADSFAPLVAALRQTGTVVGLQIAHSGRKGSANVPWEGDDHIPETSPESWQPIAPSAIAFGQNRARVPHAMTIEDIERVKADFVRAAERARDMGIQVLMLHFAHGYLAQSFWSTYSNQRTDRYGGTAENRGRFLLETLDAVRAVWPEHLPLCARFGVIEFDGKDEETLTESIALVRKMKERGLDFLDVSVGFSTPGVTVPWGAAFMAPIAARVRREVALPVATSWYINDGRQADALIRNEAVDLVMIGRPLLANPYWSYEAARVLHIPQASQILPPSYGWSLSRYH